MRPNFIFDSINEWILWTKSVFKNETSSNLADIILNWLDESKNVTILEFI